MQFQPVIRWSGGKRKQSEDIINQFPSTIGTLFIPFLGGGSVMFQAINSNIKFDRVVATDLDEALMGIWYMIKENPRDLINGYTELYNGCMADASKKVDFYNDIVEQFNDGGCVDPVKFYFLTRACTRGSLEYNQVGHFTSRMGNTDRPALPKVLEPIIMRWHGAIQDVEFRCESYDGIVSEVTQDDYVFMDPPYFDSTWYKYHNMDWKHFFEFVRNLPCDYSITLNGDKDIYPIPSDLYTKHMYIYYGISTTQLGNKAGIRDSLWIRNDRGIYTPDMRNARSNESVGGGKSNNVISDTKALFELGDRMNRLEIDMGETKGMLKAILNAIQGGEA